MPEGQPTYQYASVAIEKKLPTDVEYEILEHLYIPDENKDNYQNMRLKNNPYIGNLIEESLRITGNLSSKELNHSLINARASWRPKGKITTFDTSIGGPVGVEGLEVRATRWFTTHKGYVNSTGFYYCDGTFDRDANYSIDWERYEFSIRVGGVVSTTEPQFSINGPKITGDWNQHYDNGVPMFYSHIFRAAHHYYYKDIKGLKRPPLNGTLQPQMKIAGVYATNTDKNGNHSQARRVHGILSWIKIWNPERLSAQTYATTIHELAHASHWDISASTYNDAEKIVQESWARGVQWELTRMVYPNYFISYGRKKGGNTEPDYFYTGVVQDMIDGVNGYDQVSGYTIKQIEDTLNGIKTWNSWRDKIKNSYSNATRNNIDILFDYWN